MEKKAFNQVAVKTSIQNYGFKKVYEYVESNPKENIPKFLEWFGNVDASKNLKRQLKAVKASVKDEENNWNQLIEKIFTELDPGVRKKLVENVVMNGSITGRQQQKMLRKKYDCNVPWTILMDPTSACNLSCTGCWAAEYGNKLNLSLETWDSIITQGKEMGVYVYIYSGGEPLVRKKDIIKMCEKHSDCMFLSFTNGTLIDDEFADEMLRVKNFVPAISVEGFAEETDSRRGKGCYESVIKAMEILKDRHLLFGISCCYTKNNASVIGSELYIDEMIEKGAMFAWYFTYIPVGADAEINLIATPEQRKFMYHQLRKFRETKPIFTMDFWNDGEYVKGCVAGGRGYLHINANGDIEPCAFVHYSDSNIKDKSILEACQSPLFMEYRRNQPFNENMLRPCPLLDNPEKLVNMVENSGAKSTDLKNPENVHQLCGKCVNASLKWEKTANELWSKSIPAFAEE